MRTLIAMTVALTFSLNAYGDELPRKFFTHKSLTISKGGAPGYMGKINGKATFDTKRAKRQVRSLHGIGITTIVSLDHCNYVKRILKSLARQGIDIKQICMKIRSGERGYLKNPKVYDMVVSLVQNGENVYIHCRHGVHRAVTAFTGALLTMDEALSFEEAFKEAGGNKRNFRGKSKQEYLNALKGMRR
jgi:hypothetical protein